MSAKFENVMPKIYKVFGDYDFVGNLPGSKPDWVTIYPDWGVSWLFSDPV